MKNNSYINFPIGEIWNSDNGATIKFEIDQNLQFSSDLTLSGNLNGEFKVIKLKDSVMLLCNSLSFEPNYQCSKCLIDFSQSGHISEFEREYFYNLNADEFDPLEHLKINKKDLSIDVTEAIRQEILLQFPINPLCSERCKGICIECGVNLNQKAHSQSCEKQNNSESNQQNKPFANLKELINQSNNN